MRSVHVSFALNILQTKALEMWDSSARKESLQVFASWNKNTSSGSPPEEAQLLLRPIDLRRSSLGDVKQRLVKLLGAGSTADQYVLKIKGRDDFLLFDDLLIIQYRHAIHELITFSRLKMVLIAVDQAKVADIARVREHMPHSISDRLLFRVLYDDFNGQKVDGKPASSGDASASRSAPAGAHRFLEAMRSEIGAQAVTEAIKKGTLEPWETVTPIDEKRRCAIA